MVGQYPGNKDGVKRPYRDCKCTYHQLNNPNPNCGYITMNDVSLAKDGNITMKMQEKNITGQFQNMT